MNRDKFLDLAGELKRLLNTKVTVIPIIIGALGTISQRIHKRTGGRRNKSISRDHPNHSIKIVQNTKKNPEDMRRLAVTQSPRKNQQLTLV